MAAIDDFTFVYGRSGDVSGLVAKDTGASHKVDVTRFFMRRTADRFDISNFEGDDEKVGHGHYRGSVTISGWMGSKSGANPGVNNLGGAGVSSILTSVTGRTFSGTLKGYYIQVDKPLSPGGKFPVLIRAQFHGAITETWS